MILKAYFIKEELDLNKLAAVRKMIKTFISLFS